MFLSHICTLPSRGKALLSWAPGMRFGERRLTRQFLHGCWSPVSNAHGRAAYWLNAAFVLFVICSAVAVVYFTSGVRDKRIQPVVSLDQKEDGKPAQLYKVPMPERKAVEPAPGSSSDTVAREAPAKGYSKLPSESIASPAGAAFQQNQSSPTQIGKQPVKEVERGGPIATREDVDSKLSPGQKVGVQEITSGPDVTAKAEKGISQEVDKEPLQADAETGKRLFIRVQACNVREEPSTASRVKFRLEMGDPVNMTGKRGRWVAVKLDDGRFGWVYHTLLTDSIVLQKAAPRATKKIKAIRPEIADKDIAKIIFELNGPFPPQTMIVEGEKPRVVCDFFDAGLAADIGKSIEVDSGIVEKIRTGIHKSPKFKVRVVLDLVPRRNYEVDQFFFEKENYYVLVVKAKE